MKTVYSYHPVTKVYTEPTEAEESPLDPPGTWLIPAHATELEPPKPRKGHEIYWTGAEWKQRRLSEQRTDGIAASARANRNGLLLASDWTQLPDVPAWVNVDAWRTYRQALRDVPQQPEFPSKIVWPEKPQ